MLMSHFLRVAQWLGLKERWINEPYESDGIDKKKTPRKLKQIWEAKGNDTKRECSLAELGQRVKFDGFPETMSTYWFPRKIRAHAETSKPGNLKLVVSEPSPETNKAPLPFLSSQPKPLSHAKEMRHKHYPHGVALARYLGSLFLSFCTL